jgi:hypothetical protein
MRSHSPKRNCFDPRPREGGDRVRASLAAEILVLRHQINILRRHSPKRLRRAHTPAFRAGSLSLNPLARGCRRIWRGEIWKYGFGGAVADFVSVISGSRRRPRRSQVRGQLRHDPIATAG